MSELKPCPFCGSNDIVYEEALSVTYCNDCGGELDEGFGSDWNTRPIEDALNKRIAELEAAQRWIPVSERLPETDGQYIGYTNTGLVGAHWLVDGHFIVTYSCTQHWLTSPTTWTLESASGGDVYVTHWMPLPEPPEVQE